AGTTIKVSRGGGSLVADAPPPNRPVTSGSAGPTAAAHASADAARKAEAEAPPVSNLVDIKSPMVGTFYAKPEPGADPYVRVGNRISLGQTLCIIEAMKIMNPLDAEISGVIRQIAVEDAQPVEFGQVLFRVDPNG